MSPTPPARPPERTATTGLVLAGGRGSRMGGVDKGLMSWDGRTLAAHALERLRPQVGALAINANRNLERYAGHGAPVWPDLLPDHPGPLAGLLTGLTHASTDWLVTVPCDSPLFPADLVRRLADASAAEAADLAVAAIEQQGSLRWQPVFLLARRELRQDLDGWLRSGERKVDRWIARHRHVVVPFDRADDFTNANTPEELDQLPRG